MCTQMFNGLSLENAISVLEKEGYTIVDKKEFIFMILSNVLNCEEKQLSAILETKINKIPNTSFELADNIQLNEIFKNFPIFEIEDTDALRVFSLFMLNCFFTIPSKKENLKNEIVEKRFIPDNEFISLLETDYNSNRPYGVLAQHLRKIGYDNVSVHGSKSSFHELKDKLCYAPKFSGCTTAKTLKDLIQKGKDFNFKELESIALIKGMFDNNGIQLESIMYIPDDIIVEVTTREDKFLLSSMECRLNNLTKLTKTNHISVENLCNYIKEIYISLTNKEVAEIKCEYLPYYIEQKKSEIIIPISVKTWLALKDYCQNNFDISENTLKKLLIKHFQFSTTEIEKLSNVDTPIDISHIHHLVDYNVNNLNALVEDVIITSKISPDDVVELINTISTVLFPKKCQMNILKNMNELNELRNSSLIVYGKKIENAMEEIMNKVAPEKIKNRRISFMDDFFRIMFSKNYAIESFDFKTSKITFSKIIPFNEITLLSTINYLIINGISENEVESILKRFLIKLSGVKLTSVFLQNLNSERFNLLKG